MPQNINPIKKWAAVTALLVSTLVISNPASALNPLIGNLTSNNPFYGSNLGQSFINDPTGGNATIKLDTWTFSFYDTANQSSALASPLTIYNGTGNGGGVVDFSSSTSTAAVTGYANPVTWTFTGGLNIIGNSTYTAYLAPTLVFNGSNPSTYANGSVTTEKTIVPSLDTVFQGTFSAATPVPFEFSPALGLVGLGALCLAKKKFAKKAK